MRLQILYSCVSLATSMKKLILIVISLLLIFHTPVFAQEMSSDSAGLTQTPTIDYTLPYPGILPDNPLYPLKAFRDRIVSMLIADPVKKSLFDLLQADKRLQSAVYLLYTNDARHLELAKSTISKGENYFEEAVSQLSIAQRKRRDISGEIRQMQLAARKHEEVLQGLKAQVSDNEKGSFSTYIQRIQHIQRMLSTLQKSS